MPSLQSVVLYGLLELNGAIDTVVLGRLVDGEDIDLVSERVRKLVKRVTGWTTLRNTPPSERNITLVLYGFPPNQGVVGTAALLDVLALLDQLMGRLRVEGYDIGGFGSGGESGEGGEAIEAALRMMNEEEVIAGGTERIQGALEKRMGRAKSRDRTVAEALADFGSLGEEVRALSIVDDEIDGVLGNRMAGRMQTAWLPKEARGPGVSTVGDLIVSEI